MGDLKQISGNERLFQVDLTLSNDDDNNLRLLYERIREEIDPELKEWYRFGKLLLKIGQSTKAQQFYEVLLEQSTNDIDRALVYHNIA